MEAINMDNDNKNNSNMNDINGDGTNSSNILSNKVFINLKRSLLTLIGTLIVSISINALYIPYHIMSGGVSGIAIWLNLAFNFNTSISILLINIPIFILGYKWIDREFIGLSLIGTLSLSLFIYLTRGISFHSEEILTTILLGGVINGVGLGLILRANSSTGGNDIISKILNKYYSYSISTLNFAFNFVIIGISIGFFGVDIAVQTLATMYVSATTIKFILEGVNHKRTAFIITNKEEVVGKAINKHLGRGCTILQGKGSFTGEERSVLYAIISIRQVAKLKMVVRAVDNQALINVIETRVVFGNGKGFLNINS